MMDIRKVEAEFRGKSCAELDPILSRLGVESLIALLDSRSARIGNTAAGILSRLGKLDAVIDAVLDGRVLARIGKIRVDFILASMGKKCGRATEVYLRFLQDNNGEVVHGALFSLAFLQDKRFIPEILAVKDAAPAESKIRHYCELAIEALEKENPFIFSPYFHDAGNVWGLDPQKFANKIGMPGVARPTT
jgi:hypothetical protein